MRKIIHAIKSLIDLPIMVVQIPYVYIASLIMGALFEVAPYKFRAIYVWLPTIGVVELWIDSYGRTDSREITYKGLFS